MSVEHPRRVQHILLGVLGTIVGATVIVGLWFGGWALAHAIRGEQNKLNRNSYEFQTTYASQVRSDVVDLKSIEAQIAAEPTNTALAAQKAAVSRKLCDDAARVEDKSTFFGGDQSTMAYIDAC